VALVQLPPATHEVHTPLSQTMSVPHSLPLDLLKVPAVHTGAPVVHTFEPILHCEGAAGVHTWPETQSPHTPLLQTLLLPHEAPSSWFPVPTVHTAVPLVVQSYLDFRHEPEMVHVVPCEQALHCWAALQYMPVPQAVPAGAGPRSLQTAPALHDSLPRLQALPVGVQVAPSVQALHVPAASQTLPVPHRVPGMAATVVAVQVVAPAAPEGHDVVPTMQGLDVGTQAWSAVHTAVWHWPSKQARPVPQLVPLVAEVQAVVLPAGLHTWHLLTAVLAAPAVTHAPAIKQPVPTVCLHVPDTQVSVVQAKLSSQFAGTQARGAVSMGTLATSRAASGPAAPPDPISPTSRPPSKPPPLPPLPAPPTPVPLS